MRVVLAGASGLIGTALASALRADGVEVSTLVRRPPQRPDEDSWDPEQGLVDPDFLAGADAVVCLSGVGVGDRRWTDSYKQQILSSRVNTVSTLARSLAEHGGPRTLICASAVGYYGDTGDRVVDEQAPPGDSFLAEVCVRWEAAAQPARDAGVRVVHLRTGLVLSKRGGLLKTLRLVVKAGIGGRLGSGQQYMPWISIADEVAAIQFALRSQVSGPLNLTAPTPATNLELTRALGRVLRRPTVFAVPGFAARLALGEFAGEVLVGQRAVPTALLAAGFEFAHTDLESALRAELA
ncbi:TIGR01777 family oxidoreductase [uncultured Jatrophihabitans sp.]|uniref:TIGR01777 family oxidoreductase n=1 Tax=uncultured Jatrophihabitans sp. TaxID=1610747 RepID=UPI0035CA2D73